MDRQDFLQKALYPCVRVSQPKGRGSGQVIHSSEENGTFILTCCHVVDDQITVKDEWSNLLQRNIKRDNLAPVDIEYFKYSYQDRAFGGTKMRARIVCYDKTEDIALLKSEDPEPVKYVVTMFSCDGPDDSSVSERINMLDPVVTVGAAMGNKPVVTMGYLEGFGEIIEQREYWMSTALSIFGNSGGSTFLQETLEFIGMPARITVTGSMFATDAITHLGFIVPITRIVAFLKENMMDFLFDPSVTFAECESRIKEKRRKSEVDMLLDANK